MKIHAVHDYFHIYKNMRNALLREEIWFNNEKLSMEPIKRIHEYDKNLATKMMPKITDAHIYPNSFEKMSVNRATQLLSHAASSAIKTAEKTRPLVFDGIPKATIATAADFCGKCYKYN
jgi:hypothetical protein